MSQGRMVSKTWMFRGLYYALLAPKPIDVRFLPGPKYMDINLVVWETVNALSARKGQLYTQSSRFVGVVI